MFAEDKSNHYFIVLHRSRFMTPVVAAGRLGRLAVLRNFTAHTLLLRGICSTTTFTKAASSYSMWRGMLCKIELPHTHVPEMAMRRAENL